MHIAALATLKRMSGPLSLGCIKGQNFRVQTQPLSVQKADHRPAPCLNECPFHSLSFQP